MPALTPTIAPRLGALGGDANLDLEDLLSALQSARSDGVLSAEESAELRAALAPHEALMEPAARRLVDDLFAGRAALLPRRVLLAAVPSGGSPDLHQPRAEVVALQDALTAVGYATASDDLYGSVTASLVRTFRCAAGLPATGAVDAATLLALNERRAPASAPTT